MDWITFAALVLKESLPVALKIAEKWDSKEVVTAEDRAELKALSEKTPKSQMVDALARAGIASGSEQGKRMLSLLEDPSVNIPAAPPTAPLADAGGS